MNLYSLYCNPEMVYPYPEMAFRPDCMYPEYPFGLNRLSSVTNAVYYGVRETLRLARLDEANYGTSHWNPLGSYIEPGMRVLIKPNLVMHENPAGYGTDCLFTHPSVVAAVIDYVVIALKGKGSIIIADAPMQSCNFDLLVDYSGLKDLVDWYRAEGISIELFDMRGLKSKVTSFGLQQVLAEGATGKVVDLGKDSCFAGLSRERIDRLRITNYNPDELKKHHTLEKHEYYVSTLLLDADVVVNLPKAKTHRKAGVTGALKNMVGINVRKEYLPHHSNGSIAQGFDEYKETSVFKCASDAVLDVKNRRLMRGGVFAKKLLGLLVKVLDFIGKSLSGDFYSEGSWYGNDTIWRTVLDLNKIVFFADKEGVMQDDVQRRVIVFCDMVTIGQGEGPLLPEPGEWHMLAFCDDPCVHDVAMARLMGTDESLIATIHNTLKYDGSYAWRSISDCLPVCSSNSPEFDGVRIDGLNAKKTYQAKPTSGWAAHFERGV